MVTNESALDGKPEEIFLSERFFVFANAFLQRFGLENLPFGETYFSVSAKIEGIRGELTRIDSGTRILRSSDENGSEIKLYTVSPTKLERVKKCLRLVKIPIYEIKIGHYVDTRDVFYIIVVYKGK